MVLRRGMALRQSLLFPYTPEVLGRSPVRVAAREGLQAGDAQ